MASNGPGVANGASPRRSSVSSYRRNGSRLGAIEENGYMHPDEAVFDAPKEPPHSHSKGIGRVLPFDIAPRHVHHDRAPPPYSEWDGMKGPKGSRLSQMRASQSNTRRRGGWLKLVLIILIAILIIVALVVGLVVGLHHKHHHSSSYVVPPIPYIPFRLTPPPIATAPPHPPTTRPLQPSPPDPTAL